VGRLPSRDSGSEGEWLHSDCGVQFHLLRTSPSANAPGAVSTLLAMTVAGERGHNAALICAWKGIDCSPPSVENRWVYGAPDLVTNGMTIAAATRTPIGTTSIPMAIKNAAQRDANFPPRRRGSSAGVTRRQSVFDANEILMNARHTQTHRAARSIEGAAGSA